MKTFRRNLIASFFILVALMTILFYLYSRNDDASRTAMVWIPGGEFMMGNNTRFAHANEKPQHKVRINGFWMDKTDVTNAQFSEFVKATGYRTTAERLPDWETIRVQVPMGTPKPSDDKMIAGAMVFTGTTHAVPLNDWSRWWAFVPGADWQHPQGTSSSIRGKENHPVVQVSYEDAQAYAKWKKKELPTEAEWEFAARGGLDQKHYSWGDEYRPEGKHMANTFPGDQFPIVKPEYKAKIGTTEVGHYPPNGYGLYDMAGNVWQWVADWYRADAFSHQAQLGIAINPQGPQESFDPYETIGPYNAPKRVIRGGSFLCDESFCSSYRPSARRGVDPYNPMEHIGFRLIIRKENIS
ncbi:MAG: formylglycine-generating enzyme family protein [Gammaproteobacteria bacterium]|nr:formylglycine-generating enzyme family protein [Gammaproteobacteria bacterium]